MSDNELVYDAIDLMKNGRKNAAKAQWQRVTSECKKAWIDLLLWMITNKFEPLGCEVELRTKRFGLLVLSDSKISELKLYLPQVAL